MGGEKMIWWVGYAYPYTSQSTSDNRKGNSIFGDVNPQNFLLASLDKIGAAKKCGTDSRGTDSRGTDFSVPHLFENPEMLKSVPRESVPHFFAAPILQYYFFLFLVPIFFTKKKTQKNIFLRAKRARKFSGFSL